MELPFELKTAIERETSSVHSGLEAIVAGLSNRYRAGVAGKLFHSHEEMLAYIAYRMPATFAAVSMALRQVKDRLLDWRPQSLLDAGCGPGTVMWAAASIWPSDFQRITLLEREKRMIQLGSRLASSSASSQVRNAHWHHVDLSAEWHSPPHDLVVASYVIGELTPDRAGRLIDKLWELTAGILLIIEPGTPEGFLRIRQARERLLAAEGRAVAPCPHNGLCPLDANDWCHFAQRVSRSRLHRASKSGTLSYEDEKFSFIAVSRMREMAASPITGRVVRHPQVRKGHIYVEACTAGGIEKTVITRKNKEQFREARDLRWGSALPSSAEQ